MSSLNLTSVDVFVIVMGLAFGYLAVSHFLEPKRGARATGASAPGPDQVGSDKSSHESRPDSFPPSWESVLGVSRYASPDQIRQAYRTQIAMYHPDKVAALGDELKVIADRKTKEINVAYAAACREKDIG